MRALLTDPSLVAECDYRAFAQQAILRGLLPDHLVAGEPYLALNALVLSRSDVELLERLTRQFSRAFERAARFVATDVALLEELGFPWAAAELLATAEQPRLPLVGRFDFVRDEGGHWWLLEFNADTPSGVREAIVADRLVYTRLGGAGLTRPSAGLAPRLRASFRAALADLPPGSRLGLVTTASELEDLAQIAFTQRLLAPSLARRGIEVVFGDADNLGSAGGKVTLRGRPLEALYRYVPLEGMFGTPAFAAVYEAVARGRLRLLNGLYGLLLQNKGLLAWIWEHREDRDFSATERAAIAEHLAPTWWAGQAGGTEQRGGLVAKQVFGREGEEVFFGEDLTADQWRELRRRRTYVFQRRLALQPIEAVVPTSRGQRSQHGFTTVGAFAVSGSPAGFYTRFGGKIITSRARWLATFQEAS